MAPDAIALQLLGACFLIRAQFVDVLGIGIVRDVNVHPDVEKHGYRPACTGDVVTRRRLASRSKKRSRSSSSSTPSPRPVGTTNSKSSYCNGSVTSSSVNRRGPNSSVPHVSFGKVEKRCALAI